MTRIRFQEVAIKATHRWVDADGKKRQETRKFWQTISPFNKRPDGTLKTEADIEREITAQRDAWLATGDQQL
ncbi:hypothetical protein J2W35_003233 [Variovorax boronicumulans]|uniref:hypothetical protein n=1 Tax=Variovorax boronicumulans TaxID=436515 RepID=UPI00277E20A9|nr:hypothetical protein [Variovorax boronicumulans]MDQ0082874.1 hypothetical protein [Variovorax boronicumulans]